MNTPQLLVNHHPDDSFHLVCPVCKKEDQSPVDFETIAAMGWAGASSICIDCDPAAGERIELWPVDAPQAAQEACNA